VLILPLVVAAGLGAGRLGVEAHVAGARIATDLALAWALAAAFVLVMERPRWRRAGWVLAAAAFAVLGAGLEWAAWRALWTSGFLLEGVWVALVPAVVLASPEGRSWSRPARLAVAGALVVTLGAQLVGAFFSPDARDLLSVAPRATVERVID